MGLGANLGARTSNRPARTEILYRLSYPGRLIESVLVEIMKRSRCLVCFIIKHARFVRPNTETLLTPRNTSGFNCLRENE